MSVMSGCKPNLRLFLLFLGFEKLKEPLEIRLRRGSYVEFAVKGRRETVSEFVIPGTE